ncbi:thymidine phosphorylase family protein [Oleisolibacter albus]|uniref:thymidine phosphorylase family protein n=1 Tax=Oleisolibacter albus TaxID=2171757 RepID=UPI000DF3D10E|nr:thymidine phosphorylase family protein [Oleisolibacter albus]
MLRLKRLGISTATENVAFLSAACTAYRAAEFVGTDKVEVRADGKRLYAVLNIVQDPALLAPDCLGLSVEAAARLGLPDGAPVRLNHPRPPKSRDGIRAKIEGEVLSDADLAAIVADIAAHRYSKVEIAAFLVACAGFMTTAEVLGLTRAMAGVGERLDWDTAGPVVDKHCIGGIPGNRTSMIVVPIVAAHGLPIPKTSSRAITSPAGTADTMEVLANVDIGVDQMKEQVRAVKGCLAWGGHVNLSPADDVLIGVERPLNIDTREQMVASILSKKLAAGSTHLVIDVPLGPTAKIRTRSDALRLRKLFEYVGGALGLTLQVVLTDGSQPVGCGIGPVLEARDVMAVLENAPSAPRDLRDRALMLAAQILEFDPALRGGAGLARARELLDSGAAFEQMRRIMALQGPPPTVCTPGRLMREVLAVEDGVVTAIDCYRIARIARLAGAPFDKGAGIDLVKKVGDPVEQGEPLYRIHAETQADFHFAVEFAGEEDGYRLAPVGATPHPQQGV